MKKPVIIINLKTYQTGQKSLELVEKIEKVSKDIIIGVQAPEIFRVFSNTKLEIFVQHVDSYLPGRNTGYIIPKTVKENGASGTFLNHSEHPISLSLLKETIGVCKSIGLKTAVFARSLSEAKKIEKLNPDYLIYEPPELVAGDISVSQAKPEIIEKISKVLKMPFLVGAGIKNNNDFLKSLELGANGIAVSSAITTVDNPEEVLRELIGKKK